ncbi:ZDBF2 protein, partial [Penelope pileata]|nr:ZDBF2 protein [Penelope pileata]
MFDRIKRSDEASASSAQGNLLVILPASFSLHSRRQEHPRPGVSTVQNRQGYCNCCHVHYSNLEQHIFSSQHRHFTTYCRNRMGTSSLMERFLQDVLQHHPHRYHDNRPTYDDMPLPVTPGSARIACLSPGEVEKKKSGGRQAIPRKDQESVDNICSSAPYLSHKDTKETSVVHAFAQKFETEEGHVTGISQQSTGICSNGKKCNVQKDAQIANHSHEGQFTAVSPVPHHSSVNRLIHSSSV